MTNANLKNFLIPKIYTRTPQGGAFSIYVVIPTYKPNPKFTIRLVKDLLKFNSNIQICVIDDCTPIQYEAEHKIFKHIHGLSSSITILKTKENKLKAGAVNHALTYIFNKQDLPDVIITLDDDVVIDCNTIKNLVDTLMSNAQNGAVCSQCRVFNKNTNILTRLQGLEYLGFNAMRLADDGFFRGPLVMHGMLTAFRTSALKSAGFFTEHHLIEDYDMTTRIKEQGYNVGLAPSAYAWTEVPETLLSLWDQRVRWVYGGLTILFKHKSLIILQDVLGHALFMSTLVLIFGLIITSSFLAEVPPIIIGLIITFSLAQFFLIYFVQIWFMRFYTEADTYDWTLRLTILPEFIYGNILSVILIISYGFFVLTLIANKSMSKHKALSFMINFLNRLFFKFGFSNTWGTR